MWKDKVEIPGPTEQVLKIKVSEQKRAFYNHLSPVKKPWLWSNVLKLFRLQFGDVTNPGVNTLSASMWSAWRDSLKGF